MHEVSSTPASSAVDSTRDLTPSVARSSFDRVRASSLTIDVVVVSGVALVLGLIRIGAPSVWVDEAFTAQAVRETLLSPIDQYHWLYYSVVTPWSLVAGTSEWALRMPSVFAAMLSCGLLIALARMLVDRWAALAGGLFLATSPFLVKWSQQARAYSLFSLLRFWRRCSCFELSSGAPAVHGWAMDSRSLSCSYAPCLGSSACSCARAAHRPTSREAAPARLASGLRHRCARSAVGVRARSADTAQTTGSNVRLPESLLTRCWTSPAPPASDFFLRL